MDGFDFSQLKWLLIFAGVVIFNFIRSKQAPVAQEQSEEPAEHEMKSLEDLVRELTQGSSSDDQSPRPDHATHAAASKSKISSVRTAQEQPSMRLKESQTEAENDESQSIEFDLREAVIMSEILTRKYED
ncbi:MAG: hypothetical protein SNF93_06445 [Rikenellaceae bacterium]